MKSCFNIGQKNQCKVVISSGNKEARNGRQNVNFLKTLFCILFQVDRSNNLFLPRTDCHYSVLVSLPDINSGKVLKQLSIFFLALEIFFSPFHANAHHSAVLCKKGRKHSCQKVILELKFESWKEAGHAKTGKNKVLNIQSMDVATTSKNWDVQETERPVEEGQRFPNTSDCNPEIKQHILHGV